MGGPESIAAKGDVFFLLWASVLVFFMQTGFAMLEAGSVRSKNTKNILIKNMLDACLGALIWWGFGYGFAYGGDNPYWGNSIDNYRFNVDDRDGSYANEGAEWVSWFFQWTFAAAAATIVSGSVSERCTLTGYAAYSIVLTGLTYPVVAHWVWDPVGWLSAFNPNAMLGGAIDFAGSGVVHMTGGTTALIGAWILGPRIGRFDADGRMVPMPGHSSVLQVLGVFILWVGWYGFNGGSTLAVFALDTQYARDFGRICVTTTLSAATAAFTVVVISKYVDHVWDVGAVANGVLAGLVSITAGCVVVETWAAVVIGIVGGCTYIVAVKVEQLLKIDDPLDAWPVHGACGTWGIFAVGMFARPEYSYNQQGRSGFIYAAYAGDPNPSLMLPQFLFVAAHTAWVGAVALVLFGLLRLAGVLRVSAEVEEMGMDLSKHGGEAYYDVIKKKRHDDVVILSGGKDEGNDVEAVKSATPVRAPTASATDGGPELTPGFSAVRVAPFVAEAEPEREAQELDAGALQPAGDELEETDLGGASYPAGDALEETDLGGDGGDGDDPYST